MKVFKTNDCKTQQRFRSANVCISWATIREEWGILDTLFINPSNFASWVQSSHRYGHWVHIMIIRVRSTIAFRLHWRYLVREHPQLRHSNISDSVRPSKSGAFRITSYVLFFIHCFRCFTSCGFAISLADIRTNADALNSPDKSLSRKKSFRESRRLNNSCRAFCPYAFGNVQLQKGHQSSYDHVCMEIWLSRTSLCTVQRADSPPPLRFGQSCRSVVSLFCSDNPETFSLNLYNNINWCDRYDS